MFRIALTPTVFADVSEADFGFVTYAGEWTLGKDGLAKGVGKISGTLLHKFVAARMGLSKTQDIAFRDKNPLNCTRENLYATDFVWKRGAVRRRLECEGREPEWVETKGWIFGNVGIFQKVTRKGDWWHFSHMPSGHTLPASWPTEQSAKAAIEAMHEEGNLAELDAFETFKKKQALKWQEITIKHRVGAGL